MERNVRQQHYRGKDMSARKYQLNIALESTRVLNKIIGIHRKRQVVMRRWRKPRAAKKRTRKEQVADALPLPPNPELWGE